MNARENTYALVIDDNKGIIYKVANAYCRDREARRDLIQEILVQIWRSLDSYDDSFKRSTWIYRISLNVAISFYRKERRRQDVVPLPDHDVLDVIDESESGLLDDDVQLLYEFIGGLNRLEKAVILLYLESESYNSIASTLAGC